ncbi:hypothetical protein NE619_04930 [Anaerovorax odorimutans]|uniref:HNH endonuclease n=1 Tax=Anaerovorax odorimutans TaxID=109327 RepID=A0ABT1RLL2_9FIRM|nr:hypothetical protein [Anaerovorax odorimutans]MCQ4636062.1 hypothetical protein [Anaerovorax odorimutans]
MNYFWVFQNKTFREESQGGFLWAPQKDKLGHNKSHWSLMKEVKKGDAIVHSVNGKIAAISFAKEDCYVAQRPATQGFGDWEKQGWRVDCEYYFPAQTIRTKDYIEQIMKLQPDKNSPINRAGNGNTGYLFRASKDLFEFLIVKTATCQKIEEQGLELLSLLSAGYEYEKCNGKASLDRVIAEDEYMEEVESAINRQKTSSIEDCPKEKTQKNFSGSRRVYKRDPQVSANAIRLAGFKCEVDESHSFFLSHRTGKNYVEAHHLLPISCEDEFDVSLDVEANVVSLCPVCHRLVHHGKHEQVRQTIETLYQKRRQRLIKAGIKVKDLEDILKAYGK